MCRECFLHEEEWDAAQEAFSSALSRGTAPNVDAVKAFVAATKLAAEGEMSCYETEQRLSPGVTFVHFQAPPRLTSADFKSIQ